MVRKNLPSRNVWTKFERNEWNLWSMFSSQVGNYFKPARASRLMAQAQETQRATSKSLSCFEKTSPPVLELLTSHSCVDSTSLHPILSIRPYSLHEKVPLHLSSDAFCTRSFQWEVPTTFLTSLTKLSRVLATQNLQQHKFGEILNRWETWDFCLWEKSLGKASSIQEIDEGKLANAATIGKTLFPVRV